MRLFVALELPVGTREALHAWAAELELPFLRVVAAPALHVTLCFIGERPQAAPVRTAISALLDGMEVDPRPLRVLTARWLPARRPRVLAAELEDPGEELTGLSSALHMALGVRSEHQGFLPHVTVGRVRGPLPRPPGVHAPALTGIEPEAVSLIRSRLGGGPARYERLASWPIQ